MKRIITFGELMLRLAPEGYYRFVQSDRYGATYGGATYISSTDNPYFYLLKATSTDITDVKIHKDTVYIGDYAFMECNKLTSADIPEGVRFLLSSAFHSCPSLKSVTLPSTLEYMDSTIFVGCTSLESVYIPDGIDEIQSYFFSGCTSLKSVSLPASIKYIMSGVFDECPSNLTIEFRGTSEQWENVTKFTTITWTVTFKED